METDETQNPNSHDRLRRDTFSSWLELPQDLLISFFERLSFTDFRRAQSVCSSWHSASRLCVAKKPIHWLILFPKKYNNNCCTLFNPEEKDKLYKTQDLGLEFTKSFCLATYGSWLLMRDPQFRFYIVNLFTYERINLPSHVKCHDKATRFSVFWIDDKTKDYVVLWRLGRSSDLLYSKKGDISWNQIHNSSDCIHMVFKDYKLYFLSSNCFKIFDFSGEIPQQTFRLVDLFWISFMHGPVDDPCFNIEAKIVVTVTGQVLKVEVMLRPRSGTWSFRIFKIYPSECLTKDEEIYCLGEEAVLLDQGIPVRANDFGFVRNSIYFNSAHGNNKGTMSFFNLKTKKMEDLHHFDFSSIQFSRALWFLPNFTHA